MKYTLKNKASAHGETKSQRVSTQIALPTTSLVVLLALPLVLG